jgi:hypothetical protein
MQEVHLLDTPFLTTPRCSKQTGIDKMATEDDDDASG